MPEIDELIFRYFANATDVTIDGEQVPHTSGGNHVEYLVDGHAFFGALRQEIDDLRSGGANCYFYVANWWFGLVQGPEVVTTDPGGIPSAWTENADLSDLSPFQLDDGSGGTFPPLIDQLEGMSSDRVDVRALVWVSPLMVEHHEAAILNLNYWSINVHTLLSAHASRARRGMSDKVVLNTLAHSLGSMHLKMVVCGDDSGMRAYVSGLDFVSNRVAGPTHPDSEFWHDAGVKVEGPAANGMYNFYRQLWNEQIERSTKTFRVSGHEIQTHTEDTPPVPARTAPALTAPGTQHIQVLRTAPQMNFALGETELVPIGCFKRLVTGFRQDELSFAENGIFEFRLALRKAISSAERYIYIEDQSFSGLEIMRWINDRLRDSPLTALKVILVYGSDPDDPPNQFLDHAIREHLLPGIAFPYSQIAFYRYNGVVVHSKVTIIDDHWVAIGTANCKRRSLYTDGELSIGVLDETHPSSFAQRLRKDLWGEHCGEQPGADADPLLDLDAALGIWRATWGSPPDGFRLKSELEDMSLPFQYSDSDPRPAGYWRGSGPPEFDPLAYDREDPDSREEF